MNKILVILIFLCISIFLLRLNKLEGFEGGLFNYGNLSKLKDKFLNKYGDTSNSSKKLKGIKDNKIKNKVIIITGSTKGIGYELAKLLSRYKCKLVINGRKQETVDKVVKKLNINKAEVIGIAADLSKEAEIDKLYDETLTKFKTIDILVNNAAVIKGSRSLSTKSYKDRKLELMVNVDSVFILSQKVINYMKTRRIKGRIINISSQASKLKDTNTRSGSHILSKNMVEKMSEILADETYRFKIAVTTIRIDEDISSSSYNFMPFELPKQLSSVGKHINTFSSFFGSNPSKIMPVFLYVLKAPFYEISGKLISTNTFISNPKLSKIIPAYQLALNDNLYKHIKVNKSINYKKNPNTKLLVKQNPYGASPKIDKILHNKKFKFNKFNSPSKHNIKLDSIIAKRNKLVKHNITFFRSEYEAIKKIIDLFVTNYGEIIVIYPSCSYVYVACNEKKINIKYTVLKEINKKELQPNLYYIIRYITSKTKLIYLSSPNTVTGHSIRTKEFEDFLNNIPSNIPILIDQRYYEFSYNYKQLDPVKYLDKNIIILRSFNNFYGIENLELSYIISNKDISSILQKSQIITNPLDHFTEKMAITVFTDDSHNKKIKEFVRNEKKKIYRKLDDRNIKYYPSETNYMLLETHKNRETILKELEKKDIILYESDDAYKSYWTLPISDSVTNAEVIDIITSFVY